LSDKKLSPDSSLIEIFETVTPEEGMRVLPTKVPAPDGKAYLAVLISGAEDEANMVFANLMNFVQNMYDLVQQAQAESSIVGTDGEPIKDEPTIIV
jgi:hypothetical protein